MIRKFLVSLLLLTFLWTAPLCSSAQATVDRPLRQMGLGVELSENLANPLVSSSIVAALGDRPLSDNRYPVQQASYDDIDGTYTLLLLNTAPGQSSVFKTTNLPMARLTEEEIASGQGSYLKIEQGQPSLHLSEDFRIEYVHNVTETQVNPQTGQPEVVVVRQEPSFWTPFAGALAGQAIGSLLFTPHYYFPPVYRPGIPLTGYSSYGRTYNQAVEQHQARYNAPPTAVRNQQLRTSGQLKTASSRSNLPKASRSQPNRPTGSGYGATNLRSRTTSQPRVQTRTPKRSFGSSPRRSFSSRRR
jgi:hypothetical protein